MRKFFHGLGWIIAICGYVIAGIEIIWSFSLWMHWIGNVWGFLVALTVISDLIMFIRQIVLNGFNSYVIMMIFAFVLVFLGFGIAGATEAKKGESGS